MTAHSQLFSAALQHHQHGRLAEAEQIYREILAADSSHLGSLNFLGVIAHQGGRHQEATELIGKAISLNDGIPDCHNAMGEALRALGRLDEAIVSFNQAITLDPNFAEAHNNLGSALAAQDKLEPAVAAFRQALALKPHQPLTQSNLGQALARLGKFEEAEAAFRASIAARPANAEAHAALGQALSAQGRLDAAAECFEQALSLAPDSAEMLRRLGTVQLARGDADAAIRAAQRALTLTETFETKALFAQILISMRDVPDIEQLDAVLVRAITEAWARPTDLARVAANALKRDTTIGPVIARASATWPAQAAIAATELDAISRSDVLRAVLISSPIWDGDLERLLTLLRIILLNRASGATAATEPDENELTFWCAFACQCFINEYVFARSNEELGRLSELWHKTGAALQSGAPVSSLAIVGLAAYGPLHAINQPDALLERTWPEPVRAVLKQQIQNPREERDDQSAIPRLTEIDDAVSRNVRRQYEENPYPCWVRPVAVEPVAVDTYLAGRSLASSLRSPVKNGSVSLLIAGCGTGQHAIETAQRVPQARALAIDLSLASLAYARRQARALGITNVEFGQADILQLGSIGRSFDVIEASGVLHHLGDLAAGLRVLHSLLNADGLLRLGLYSAIARTNIATIREYIARGGYEATPDGIRRCRQDLLGYAAGTPQHYVTRSPDFFSTSACRDLLFHVQEHRLTLAEVKNLLKEFGLEFLGFEHDSFVFERYRSRFPMDAAMTDLDNWHVFEIENPSTFSIMYQFWTQKR